MQQTISDCRVYERHACQVPTSCQPAASNEMRWNATIEDISLAGVRLRLRRRFEPRAALAIELPGRDGQEPATVYVRIVHVRNLGDGHYTLGCKFMSELSHDELDRLLALGEPESAAAAVEPEEPRRTVVPNVRLWIGARRGQYVRCRAKRFHVAGSWPILPGTTLHLQGVAGDGSQLQHAFEVVHCGQEAEGWAVRLRAADAEELPAWVLHRVGQPA